MKEGNSEEAQEEEAGYRGFPNACTVDVTPLPPFLSITTTDVHVPTRHCSECFP